MDGRILKETKKCWICGKDADSGEHKIKKSLLNKLFSDSFKSGDMLHFKDGKYSKIHGSNSKKLKQFVLCSDCNNTKTQPFDLAFEKFHNYVIENSEVIIKKRFINFYDIYGDDFPKQQTNLFKYFVKRFGCDLSGAGHKVPFDLVNLLNKDFFTTALKISFSIIEEATRLDDPTMFPAGIGPLITSQENVKTKAEPDAWYMFDEYFAYLKIFFWYGIEVGACLGSEWIANKQCVYLGSVNLAEDSPGEATPG